MRRVITILAVASLASVLTAGCAAKPPPIGPAVVIADDAES